MTKSTVEVKSEENSQDSLCSSSFTKKSSKNSPFHNFQKHLVVTLRQTLSLKSIFDKAQP